MKESQTIAQGRKLNGINSSFKCKLEGCTIKADNIVPCTVLRRTQGKRTLGLKKVACLGNTDGFLVTYVGERPMQAPKTKE